MIGTKKIVELLYSPEFVSRLLHRFISGAQSVNQKGIKYELIYFLLPIVMNDTFRKSLKNAKSSSLFEKLILSEINKFEIYYLNDYVLNMKKVTNEGLIFLCNYSDVSVGRYLKTAENISFKANGDLLGEYYRSSYYLGLLLSKEDYAEIFLKTRVKCI